VQLLGGDIKVESTVGQGSVFTFHVRLEKIDADTIEIRPKTRRVMAVESGQPRYRILVVDDRLINRQLLSKLLLSVSSSSAGFEVREAANGKEALAIWKEWNPDLIWMDIRMPVMNGYDATKQIKNTDNGRETIVIALTAISLEDEEKVAVSVGCNDFLRKPFHEADIFHLLNKHLGVRFLYEADTDHHEEMTMADFHDVVTPEALAGLSDDLRIALSQAIETIDLELTLACIERIRVKNRHLAKALSELANNYRFDILQELLNPVKAVQ
jgi:CheY-like chemotaxis protein